MRVPGFVSVSAPAPTDAVDDGPATSAVSNPPGTATAPPLDPRRGARQLNSRISLSLHERYRRLLRDLEDEGYATSMTELVHALLHAGPTTTTEARALIRAWRRAVDPDR